MLRLLPGRHCIEMQPDGRAMIIPEWMRKPGRMTRLMTWLRRRWHLRPRG